MIKIILRNIQSHWRMWLLYMVLICGGEIMSKLKGRRLIVLEIIGVHEEVICSKKLNL